MSSLLSNLKTCLLLQKHGDLGYHYSSTEGLLRCHKIEKFRVANGTESNRLKHFLQIREIVEKGLGIFVLPQVLLISSIKPEVGVAQNSSQVAQVTQMAQVAQLRNLRCALCLFFPFLRNLRCALCLFFQRLRNLRLQIVKSNVCCALIVNFFS